jgi:hypothetical protein
MDKKSNVKMEKKLNQLYQMLNGWLPKSTNDMFIFKAKIIDNSRNLRFKNNIYRDLSENIHNSQLSPYKPELSQLQDAVKSCFDSKMAIYVDELINNQFYLKKCLDSMPP